MSQRLGVADGFLGSWRNGAIGWYKVKQMIYIAVLRNPKITAEPLYSTPCSLDHMPLPTIRRF